MGFELRREIRDLLPAGLLTASERLLVLELADACNDKTRQGWPGAEWLADKCDIPSVKRVGEHFASVARKWFELRVEIGKDRKGQPFYATPKRRVTYRMPTRAELVACHGEGVVPEIQGVSSCKAPKIQGPKVPEFWGAKVPKIQGPFSSVVTPQKNSSSLSPRESSDSAPIDVDPKPEREIEEAAQNNQTGNPVHRLLLDAGCPSERLTEAERWITDECLPRGLGWWRKTAGNGDLKVHVAAFLGDGTSTPAGHAGRFRAVADGNAPFNQNRYVPWRPPEDQSEYDRPFSGQVVRSPADQRLADAAPLYAKYRAMEDVAEPHHREAH